MAEYIDRDRAVAFVEAMPSKADALNVLRELKAADVAPVRRGRWILCRPLGDGTPDGYMCSVCHVGGWEKTNFFPNCGARMDGGQDDKG